MAFHAEIRADLACTESLKVYGSCRFNRHFFPAWIGRQARQIGALDHALAMKSKAMRKMLKIAGSTPLLLALTACQSPTVISQPVSAVASEGRMIARTSCASCHGTAPGITSSPNPDAPAFASIVNQEGLTKETLSTWLRDAHNYPGEMAFELDAAKVDRLVEYMLTLRDPKYTPPAT